ncbi:MAG TPA: DUF1508 domain-containing protein [Hansschlegelia sp.]
MPTSLDEILAALTPERQERIARLSVQLAEEEAAFQRSAQAAAGRSRFEIYRDVQGAFRFRLVSSVGAVVMNSEGYATKETALEAISLVRRSAADAEVIAPAA